MIRVVIVCLATMLLPHFALSASFDCHKNKGAAEQTICAHPDLSALDDEMAALYFKVTKELSRSRAASVKEDQRRWLRQRRACGFRADCIRALYNSRIAELSGSSDFVDGGAVPESFTGMWSDLFNEPCFLNIEYLRKHKSHIGVIFSDKLQAADQRMKEECRFDKVIVTPSPNGITTSIQVKMTCTSTEFTEGVPLMEVWSLERKGDEAYLTMANPQTKQSTVYRRCIR